MITKYFFVILSLLFTFSAFAENQFSCRCVSKSPGIGKNEDKICSYDCSCDVVTDDGRLFQAMPVSIDQVITSATSLESWDLGSLVCHGQYSWKPVLDAPNWKIEVRFSKFIIDRTGTLTYEESTEIASGVRSQIHRSQAAPEILEALKARF